jgi:hypothetical protein
MNIFLFLSFPFLFLASCIGNYQNETSVNIALPVSQIVEEAKTLEAPISEVSIKPIIQKTNVSIPTVSGVKVTNKNIPDNVGIIEPINEISELTDVKIEVVEVRDRVETPVDTAIEPALSNDDYYTNVDGEDIHSPAYAPSEPVGATAVCRDGTYSFSQHRSGTCSRHGGVARWLN